MESIVSFLSGREPKHIIQAISNVSLEVKAGEIVGIIGDNGSGKSTLLRIVSNIYRADSGTVETFGKIISLINLGVGLKERLNMKDNIYMLGTLFGLTNKKIQEKFDSIVSFSGLHEFVHTKIYQFSEGMKQRLAFSVAIHANPDILIIDEVFEVGDEDFRVKSASKIKELVSHGASVLLVSHDKELINKYCSKTIKIDKGNIE